MNFKLVIGFLIVLFLVILFVMVYFAPREEDDEDFIRPVSPVRIFRNEYKESDIIGEAQKLARFPRKKSKASLYHHSDVKVARPKNIKPKEAHIVYDEIFDDILE